MKIKLEVNAPDGPFGRIYLDHWDFRTGNDFSVKISECDKYKDICAVVRDLLIEVNNDEDLEWI